ncbi:MAG: NADH:ubiquinone oxidoreductase subunit NDUFA12 [Sphingobium sp.]|nr:NADH:ubiquinone oxidoreductase subunit NDUFA12 [Sphingobium sp.]
MGILMKIFTWWEGATIGTSLYSWRKGSKVGEDHQGNVYCEGGAKSPLGDHDGPNDASRVPSEWHGWLHHSIEGTPESFLPPPRIFEKDFTPNLTGTAHAYRPKGALERGGRRAAATGDYEAWSPDAS